MNKPGEIKNMKFNDHSNELYKAFQFQTEMIEKIMKPYREQFKKISIELNPVFEQIRKQNQIIAQTLQQYFSSEILEKSFKKIREGLIETEEDLKVFKFAMVDLGYPPHGDIDIPRMRLIAKAYKDIGKKHLENNIDGFMIRFYNDQRIRKIGLDWEKKELLKDRLPLLRNAIMAHNLGMFDLVVPSIISQLEGIIIKAFNVKGRIDGKTISILLENLLLKNKEFQSGIDFDDAIHQYYSNYVLVSFEHGKETNSDISRNAILHGADTKFGKQTVSLKVILLFDYIVKSISELKEQTIINAKKAVRDYRKRRYSKR